MFQGPKEANCKSSEKEEDSTDSDSETSFSEDNNASNTVDLDAIEKFISDNIKRHLQLQKAKEDVKKKRRKVIKEIEKRRTTEYSKSIPGISTAQSRDGAGSTSSTQNKSKSESKNSQKTKQNEKQKQTGVDQRRQSELTLEKFAAQATREAKKRSKKADPDRPFTIDADWVVARCHHFDMRCELCGKIMTTKYLKQEALQGKFRIVASNVSLDRIDNSLGYTRENVQIVHVRCNLMKMDMSQEVFVRHCENIAIFQNQKRKQQMVD